METIDAAYNMLLWGSVIFLSLLLCACLILAILGPRSTDRIVAINLVCTKTIIIIAVLSYMRADSSLLDVAIVYSMISFLVVVVLSKCYVSLHHTNPFNLPAAPRLDNASGQSQEEYTK
ncbi:MAG: monovalent cation/H+ antiporter complex subunit F [Treponema sp.]|nr:monovalent cation/H+ antiporter complex subunit F [Treponema sp.]